MTIAFDSASARSVWTTTPDPFIFSFTPVGTAAGILVLIHNANSLADMVTSVSYGGVPMTEVSPSPLSGVTTCTYAYFLGAGIPTGIQDVSVDHNAAASGKRVLLMAVTATSGETAVADSDGVFGALMADPSVTLQTGSGVPTFVGFVARIWDNLTTETSPGTGFTEVAEVTEGASPNGTGGFYRGTSIFSGGDVTCQVVTTNNSDSMILAVAIKEVSFAPKVMRRIIVRGQAVHRASRW